MQESAVKLRERIRPGVTSHQYSMIIRRVSKESAAPFNCPSAGERRLKEEEKHHIHRAVRRSGE